MKNFAATDYNLQINPAVGSPPKLQDIAPGDLHLDATYQRSLEAKTSRTLIRRMAANWDWRMFQPIEVARRADGTLWIVDGQHRHAAAVLRGDIPLLPCVISDFGSVADEAAAFVRINKERRPLSSVDVFHAELAAGKQYAVDVSALIAAANLTVAPHQNYLSWKPRMIYCVPGVVSAYRRFGRDVTAAGLRALSEAFSGAVLRYGGSLVQGLFLFYRARLNDATFDDKLFLERLALNTQEQWIRKGVERIAATGEGRAAALMHAFSDAYRTAGGGSTVTSLDTLTQKARFDLTWCEQCQKRKAPEDIRACADRFCKVKAKAAA